MQFLFSTINTMTTTFRTIVEVPDSNHKIGYSDITIFLGSCFAENIGSRFVERLLPSNVNPLGVMYNPISVADTLTTIINGTKIEDEDLALHNGLWHSFRLHGSFSAPEKENVIKRANDAIRRASTQLKKASTIVITFGTSWVFRHIESNKVVANCHKYPSAAFEHYRLTPEFITQLWSNTIDELKRYNPNIKILLTVSPIRHWKDGASGNNLSKATLHVAVASLIEKYPDIEYFPAYEIMMDELRDYRFYADDMLHPSKVAQDYIFKKFSKSYLKTETMLFGEETGRIVKTLTHHPLHGKTENYTKLIENTIVKIENLKKRYPLTDVTKLLNIANSLLN